MAIPFTVDISAFYGEPDFREQDSGTIVDRRKTLNLHKELEAPVQSKRSRKRTPKRASKTKGAMYIAPGDHRSPTKTAGAIAFSGATKDVSSGGGCKSNASGGAIGFSSDTGGALAFNEAQLMNELTGLKKGGALGTLAATIISNASGGAIGFSSDTGGALAFNEAQLMNELTGLKKGGALGTLAATIIPALIQMAPQIISSLKSLISGKEGGALKFGGASAVFLNGINPGDYDDVLKTMKAIERQSKNIEVRGGALYAGSSRVGTFF